MTIPRIMYEAMVAIYGEKFTRMFYRPAKVGTF